MPSTGMEYGVMALEVQCAGSMSLDEWYCQDIWQRTLKIAVMIMPRIFEQLVNAHQLPSAMG